MLAAMTHAPMEKEMETLMTMKRPKPDPVLEAQLDRAFSLVACDELVPPEMVTVFRNYLRDVLMTHPVGSLMLDRVRPRPAPSESGDVNKPGSLHDETPEETAPTKKQGGAA